MYKELPKYLAPRDENPENNKEYKYIPKKIFQTWETNQVSSGMYDAVHTWIDKNPDWEYHFFDKDDLRNFIRDNFPKKVLAAYDTLIPGAFKADLWRYCVLYIHGGVYVDSKAELLISLNDVIPSDVEFLSVKDRPCDMREPFGSYILQAFICSKPKHLFLEKVINLIVENAEIGYYGLEPISPTGPGVLGKAINLVLNRSDGFPNLLGANHVADFKYLLWDYPAGGKITCDNIPVFSYEYHNYRHELLRDKTNNSANMNYWMYSWIFDRVYSHDKVLKPREDPIYRKLYRKHVYLVARKLYKHSNDKFTANKCLSYSLKECGILRSHRILMLYARYNFMYPLFKLLKLKK